MSRQFFALLNRPLVESEFDLPRPLDEHFAEVPFYCGKRLRNVLPPTRIRVTSFRRSDFFEAGSIIAVSARLQRCLEAARINAEFLPIDVRSWPWLPRRWFFLNPLDVLPCIDFERSRITGSKIDLASGYTFTADELHLDESKTCDSVLFVVKEKSLIVIRSDLMQTLVREGFNGLEFRAIPGGPF